jgi:hypothetical protein
MAMADTSELNWQAITFLLNAPSKKSALKCFNRAFINRNALDKVRTGSCLCFSNTRLNCIFAPFLKYSFLMFQQMPLAAVAQEFSIDETSASNVCFFFLFISLFIFETMSSNFVFHTVAQDFGSPDQNHIGWI